MMANNVKEEKEETVTISKSEHKALLEKAARMDKQDIQRRARQKRYVKNKGK